MMCLKLSLLLSVELLVLIAAIFLLVYITKQQVSKWFSYGAVSIIIVNILIMVCTVCCSMCMRHCGKKGMKKECRMEEQCGPGPMMFHKMHGGCSEEMMMRSGCSEKMMMRGGRCEKEMRECEEGEGGGECEDMGACKMGMGKGEDHCIKKEIIITSKDSVKKKK